MNDILIEIKNQPITVEIAKGLWPIPHLHKDLEMIYVEKGSVIAYTDKKCYHLTDGDVFLAFPNQVHFYENSCRGKYHLIIFSPDILFGIESILSNNVLRRAVIDGKKDNTLTKLIKKLPTDIKASENPIERTVQAGLLNQIMAHILKSEELKPRIKSDNATLQNILNYCEQNFENDLTLENVAESLHLNKYHISHILNQKLSISFSAYVNSLRIVKACDLLENTNKKTSDISEEVGFGSIRSFNRAFMSILKTTPLKYRSGTNALDRGLIANKE